MAKPVHLLEVEAQYLLAEKFSIKEAEFQRWVENWASANDWLWYHTYRSVRSNSGWPDLVLISPSKASFQGISAARHMIVAELKTEHGILTSRQKEWTDALRECGVDVRTWRPSDVPEILELLRMPT